MKTFAERVRGRRLQLGISQGELARLAGMSQQGIDSIEAGASRRPRRLIEIAQALQTTTEWLLSGNGSETDEHHIGNTPEQVSPTDNSGEHPLERVPEVMTRGGMGIGGDGFVENDSGENGYRVSRDAVRQEWGIPPAFLSELGVSKKSAWIIEVKGDSMLPTLAPGDRVMIDTTDQVISPEGIFAIWDGLGVAVKRVSHIPRSDPPAVKVISDNNLHEAKEYTYEEIRIIGRAVWFGRRM